MTFQVQGQTRSFGAHTIPEALGMAFTCAHDSGQPVSVTRAGKTVALVAATVPGWRPVEDDYYFVERTEHEFDQLKGALNRAWELAGLISKPVRVWNSVEGAKHIATVERLK